VFAPPPPPDSAWFVTQKTWGKSWLSTFAEGVLLVSLVALPAWCCFTDAGYAAVGYKILTSEKRDAVIEYLAPLQAVMTVDAVKDNFKPVVLQIEKLHLRDHWLSCKIKLYDTCTKLQLETIPKKLQLKLQPSPELLEALAAKKEICREKLAVIVAYFRREPPAKAEWVTIPTAPPQFEGS
jgi:hypothetical protein